MAISKLKTQSQLNTVATTILPVVNTSGVDLGTIHITNVSQNQIQCFLGVVPTGSSFNSGNAIVWNTAIGSSGFLNISIPLFAASGDSIIGSGSSAGLNAYVSYLKLN